mgnify:CR=1 FL=1
MDGVKMMSEVEEKVRFLSKDIRDLKEHYFENVRKDLLANDDMLRVRFIELTTRIDLIEKSLIEMHAWMEKIMLEGKEWTQR